MHYHRSFGKSILFVAILFGLVLGVFIGGFAESYASNVPEKLSSYDHVEESRISLTGNSVFIDTNYDKISFNLWYLSEETKSNVKLSARMVKILSTYGIYPRKEDIMKNITKL